MVCTLAEQYVFAPAKLPTTLCYRQYAAAWDRAYTDADNDYHMGFNYVTPSKKVLGLAYAN